jgi:predicted dehydrogenase
VRLDPSAAPGAARIREPAAGDRPADLPRPRLGFLGVGWIGRHRLEAIVASGAAEACAIADTSRETGAAAGAAVPGAEVVDSFEALLTRGLDGIVIATPNALHAEQSIAALERGLAVFCQKPLGRTAEETRRVVESARHHDRLLGVDLSYRYTQAFRRLRDCVASGGIGRVYAADLVFHNAYGPDKTWFYEPALSGGGCVMDLGVHLADLALWILGFPSVDEVGSRLYSGGVPVRTGTSVEDYATARLDLRDGATVQLACSWKLSAGQDAVISAAFYGTEGGVAARNVNGSFFDFVAERYRGTGRESLAEPPDDWGGRAVVAWAERLAAGARYDPAAEQLVEVARIVDRIYGR